MKSRKQRCNPLMKDELQFNLIQFNFLHDDFIHKDEISKNLAESLINIIEEEKFLYHQLHTDN